MCAEDETGSRAAEASLLPRAVAWAQTMSGHRGGAQVVQAHADSTAPLRLERPRSRQQREDLEARTLTPGATLAAGAGHRAIAEEPDPERTCFERDRDRILHSTAFRRLAGKTQVVVWPTDHQRTRLTHAVEVMQVASSIARAVGANVALTEAIALGHDCGHGPGGHASEDAFDLFLPEGYDHGPWGADVVLTALNLCTETLDGVRNHSWSRPAPSTVEGEIVSWADRIAYCAHDLEDAVHAGLVRRGDVPADVVAHCGTSQREQLGTFISAVVTTVVDHGRVGMDPQTAELLGRLRAFNYERIYTRPESVAQARSVVAVLQALVEHLVDRPRLLPDGQQLTAGSEQAVRAAVTWVGGMTDRYAFDTAVRLLDWDPARLPKGIDRAE